MGTWSANRCRYFHELSPDFRGARVSRAGFGVAPKQAFSKARIFTGCVAVRKFATARTRSPARETRALPRPARSRDSLRAFFKCGRFTAQIGENFAGEVE